MTTEKLDGQNDVAKETIENMKTDMMDSIRNEMIKDVVWHIEYHSNKLEEFRLKLKVLQNGRID